MNTSCHTTGEGEGANAIRPLHQCEDPEPEPEYVHRQISAAVAILVDDEYMFFEGGRGWEWPGGKMEACDSTPIDCAVREVFEETGLRLERGRMKELGFVMHDDYMCVLYLADYSGAAFHGSTMYERWQYVKTPDSLPQIDSRVRRFYEPTQRAWEKYGTLLQAIAERLI